MAYIDHVECGTCGKGFQPEALEASDGAVCPHCGADLSLIDFFGVSDAFQEPDAERFSLDDLVGGRGERPAWEDPSIDPIGARTRRPASSENLPTKRSRPLGPDTPQPSDEGKSVLDVLREMKRGK